MIKKIRKFLLKVSHLFSGLNRIERILVSSELEKLRQLPRYQDDKCLIRFGYKIYSQNDEDGIIREIFNRIGVTNKTFVEFGVENGLENNSLALLFDGWNGLWIEGSPKWVDQMNASFTHTIKAGKLSITNAFIDKDNINELISAKIKDDEIDLLSIDIDGNDFHVFDAISCVSPRVVIIEYNAKFRPPTQYCMSYDKNHIWQHDDNSGASLKFLQVKLENKGYLLVGCNLTGSNAFFVRKKSGSGQISGTLFSRISL